MVEEYKLGETIKPDILIKKCTTGFMVKGNIYASDELRAFSTAEGLIEWLSRELGAGPIVWSLTLEIWMKMAGMVPEDLLPVPDPSVDLKGYREAIEGNAAFLLRKFVETHLKEAVPQPPPEPKPKKEKKVKEKISKRFNSDFREPPLRTGGLKEEKPKEEFKVE